MMDELLQETRDPQVRTHMCGLLEQARQACIRQMLQPQTPDAFEALQDKRTAVEAAQTILDKLEGQ